MDNIALAGLGILLMLILVFLRVPIAYAMLGVGLAGAAAVLGAEAALQLVASDVYRQFGSYSLTVIPLFILMGKIVHHTGASSRLFHAAYTWIGHLPGGVALTTILGSIGFSAISGSNSAATATMGSVAIPELKKYNYNTRVAAGAVAVGGTLGALIPPSTALIIIAVQSEQSIARLFKAALVPGLVVGLMLLVTAWVICARRPELGPPGPKSSWRERMVALGGVTEVAALFLLTIGGIFVGLFTPTEAAAVGAFGAIVIAVLRRSLTWEVFLKAVFETLATSAMVVLLVTSAVVFGRFLAVTRMPFELASWVAELGLPAIAILMVVMGIYIIGGALMDALGFLVISIPIFFPLITGLGYDLVWFTIIATLLTTLGAVTPPIGVNVFVVAAMEKTMDSATVFKGVAPYYIPYAVALTLFIVFPDIILFAVV